MSDVIHKPATGWDDSCLPIAGAWYVCWYPSAWPAVGTNIHGANSLADRWNWGGGPIAWMYVPVPPVSVAMPEPDDEPDEDWEAVRRRLFEN
jgi:hypothetical protein